MTAMPLGNSAARHESPGKNRPQRRHARRTAPPLRLITCLSLAALSVPTVAAQPATAHPYAAQPGLQFEYPGDPALLMPTAIAIASDGTVYLADGARDRVVAFDTAGRLVREIAAANGANLSRPMSVKLGRDGRLWIADTGNQRILASTEDADTFEEFRPPSANPASPPDYTDIAVDDEGRVLWIVDNDNHQVWRLDLNTGDYSKIGERGESLGQFDYPLAAVTNPQGDIFITEALNGRVQILDRTGRVVGSIAVYGADLGNLYRATGIAIDSEGNVWVADSAMGAIQVFQPNGTLIDVLRGDDGEPLKLDTPFGVALDANGDLYATEMTPNVVRRFAVQRDPSARGLNVAARLQAAATIQPRTCAACHREWLEPLASGESTALMDVPDSSTDHPSVTRPRTCMGCHDGAIVDSRLAVWGRHGHQTGIVPPDSVAVPDNLPLPGGKIYCRTCHSAHTRGGSGNVLKDAVFLRTEGAPADLCVACHCNFLGGPSQGMHPLGEMDQPVPQSLVEVGARIPQGSTQLDCLVCHEGHGALGDLLLVQKTETNELCFSCHEQMRPGMFRDDQTRPPHPFAVMNDQQRAAVDRAGAQVGPNGELICLSCHKMHGAKSDRFILTFGNVESDTCLQCHSDKQVIDETPHDLRTNYPDSVNDHGMRVTDAGACSACHLFHNYARPLERSALDPQGECMNCHKPDGLAAAKALGDLNHPKESCDSCHDPHDATNVKFLKKPTPDLCLECHEDKGALRGGPHDFIKNAPQTPDVIIAIRDTCLACHRTHGTTLTGLFRVPTVVEAYGPDAACLGCHPRASSKSRSDITMMHPTEDTYGDHGLPLSTQPDSGRELIGCRTCHDPHRGGDPKSRMLRIGPDEDQDAVCLKCHLDQAGVLRIGHAPDTLLADGFENTDACQPCHSVHGDPLKTEPRFLWSRELDAEPTASSPRFAPTRHCVACHREGGPVAPPAIATHPAADMFNPFQPSDAGYLPLFNDNGEIDPTGNITCKTCHLTHGHAATSPENARRFGALPPRERRARQWHLRSFGPASVCTTCHGADALRRLMYFHDPVRRTGPIQP